MNAHAPTGTAPLAVGDRIYYRGDIANAPGWLTVTRVHPPDRWMASESYDCDFDPDDRDGGGFARATIHRLADVQISRVDQGHGGTRFVTETAHRAFRDAQIAKFQQPADGGEGHSA